MQYLVKRCFILKFCRHYIKKSVIITFNTTLFQTTIYYQILKKAIACNLFYNI